jgi:hypothetical protein
VAGRLFHEVPIGIRVSADPAESAILAPTYQGGDVGATGLAANPTEYRDRLREQSDEQLDAWTSELLRDVARRRGVAQVVSDFRRTAHLDEKAFRRVFARGGGAPQTVGTDAAGHLMMPSISLHFLVPGLRAELPDARDRLISYLVGCFDEIVYV